MFVGVYVFLGNFACLKITQQAFIYVCAQMALGSIQTNGNCTLGSEEKVGVCLSWLLVFSVNITGV